MANFHFDLVAPDRLVFAGEVAQVDVPGFAGDFGVLAGHAPLVATLRPGILTVFGDAGAQRIVITGGFAEVGPSGLTVLADSAVAAEEFNREALASDIQDTEEDAAATQDAWQRDKLTHRLEQLKTLQAALANI